MSRVKKYRLGNYFIALEQLEVGGWNGSGRRSIWQATVISPDSSEQVVGRFDTENLARQAAQKKVRES